MPGKEKLKSSRWWETWQEGFWHLSELQRGGMAAAGPDLGQCQGRGRSQGDWKAHGKQGRRVMGTSVLKLALRGQEIKW